MGSWFIVAGHIIVPIISLAVVIMKILDQREKQQAEEFSENRYISQFPQKSAGWGRLLLALMIISTVIEIPWAVIGFILSLFSMDAPGSSAIYINSAIFSIFIGLILNIVIIVICLNQKSKDRYRMNEQYYR